MRGGHAGKQRITRRTFLRGAVGSVAGWAALSLRPPFAVPATAPAVVRSGQDIRMGIGTDVVIMDARIQQPGPAKSQIMHVTEQLIWPDNDGRPVGILTSAWEPMLDPPGWRFRLRPGIKFTNGEPLNAQSMKYTVESILSDDNKAWVHPDPRTRLGRVIGVKVEDDLTVVLLNKTFYRAMPIDTYERPILPPRYGAERGREFGVNPIGTGHYKFVEYRSKSHLRLEVNSDYHGHWDGKAKNTSVTFRYLSENATRVAALEAGEVHLIDNLPPDAVERVRRNPSLDVRFTPSTRINGMNFHCGRPPFNNLRARLAAVHAIDREAIAKRIMGGMTAVATAPFPPGTVGIQGQSFAPFPYDLVKARQLFREAGLTNGTRIKVGGPVGRYINDKQVVTAVAGMLAEIGFDPQIEQLEFGTYWPKVTAGDYDMFYVGWATFGYDPVDFRHVYMGWSADNGGATHFVEHNTKVVELFEAANRTPSQSEALQSYQELAHLIWDNVPIAQLFYEPNIAGVSKKLRGWKPRRDTMVYLWEAYLE